MPCPDTKKGENPLNIEEAKEILKQYDDIGASFLVIESLMTKDPDAYPDGIPFVYPDSEKEIRVYVDEKGIYGALKIRDESVGITRDEILELIRRNYLAEGTTLEYMIAACMTLGIRKVIELGRDVLTIEPNGSYEMRAH